MKIKVINDQVEKAIKTLKIRLAKDGVFRELKRRRFYEKPSVRKKRKQAEAKRRRRKGAYTFRGGFGIT
ncbi:MAG TPA: 30S ribosomal protein S21 [Nitrospiria bacterium]|nr:30S ribosomal protein S21 [Nitrospiria bacterium]